VRVRSKWTPGGMALWLIAAIVATLVVCNGSKPRQPTTSNPGAAIDVEIVE